MIHIVTDIVKLYTAMFTFYFLKWPFAVRVIVGVGIIFFGVYLGIKLTFFLVKKIGIPLLFGILKYAIYALQWIVFQISKVIPKFQETGGKFDEVLNALGMKSEEWHEQLKEKSLQKAVKGKVLWGGFFILMAISVIFVIIPYHMEPMLSGNAKNICARINKLSTDFEGKIRDYTNQHYTPAIEPEIPEEQEQEDAFMEMEEEHYVLRLGKKGYNGANLRSTPEKAKGNIITAVSGDIELFYENEMVEGDSTVWLKVSTEDVEEAWISKKLIRKKDLKAAGIQ